jgi:hypothetical protein
MIPSARETQLTQQLRAAETELAAWRRQGRRADRYRAAWQNARRRAAEYTSVLARTVTAAERGIEDLGRLGHDQLTRAAQAESRIAAVRELADRLIADGASWDRGAWDFSTHSVGEDVLAALDGSTTSTAPEAATCPPDCDGGHMYDGQCQVSPQLDDVIGQSTDPQHPGWYWSCEGDESGCEGWFSLDHASAAAARRSYDRHVARDHQTAEARP